MQALVSVHSVPEVELVLAAGISLIDLKETSHGALAALDLTTSKAIVVAVNQFRQQTSQTDIVISATVGDDCDSPTTLHQRIDDRLHIGVEVIKLPMVIWGQLGYQATIDHFLKLRVPLIAVMTPASMAAENMHEQLKWLAQQKYWGVMVDTQDKSNTLTALVSISALQGFVQVAKSLGLFVGIAGGLQLAHFETLAALNPDYLGFRSGLCAQGQRAQALLPEKVDALASRVSQIC
ncbi:(5-formylfuran-3-yl)methyl phosphate synthase [Methylophilus medardicus]|uniref:(5-formylfuran-3-yl)methyl phosphate synthase n=1 Tax=Methylophilus medardicus TaxID=2588534 RepID=A0A5B8CS11_9PROT|nr:(5-formylfuran-3-yl)methyl phosphate synthase [Methylophilus medardicus]QDC44047.1 hypothetical protein FIU01_05595 [Methylophilus medardicus]QDC49054.1 hypothetical protein FIU00_05595 [Methylophilus medardicus]QDC52759.1 hypothetical protein FIT99_05595 [Methylophilus medardicus]